MADRRADFKEKSQNAYTPSGHVLTATASNPIAYLSLHNRKGAMQHLMVVDEMKPFPGHMLDLQVAFVLACAVASGEMSASRVINSPCVAALDAKGDLVTVVTRRNMVTIYQALCGKQTGQAIQHLRKDAARTAIAHPDSNGREALRTMSYMSSLFF